MSSEAPPQAREESAAPAADFAAATSVTGAARALWEDVRGIVAERVRLVTLELRVAGLTLVQLVMYSVIVAVLVITAWLGIVSGVMIGFVSAGLHWAVAIGIGVAINLVVAFVLVRMMIRLVERISLPATLRRLEGKPAAE
jgi:hypothetical protein